MRTYVYYNREEIVAPIWYWVHRTHWKTEDEGGWMDAYAAERGVEALTERYLRSVYRRSIHVAREGTPRVATERTDIYGTILDYIFGRGNIYVQLRRPDSINIRNTRGVVRGNQKIHVLRRTDDPVLPEDLRRPLPAWPVPPDLWWYRSEYPWIYVISRDSNGSHPFDWKAFYQDRKYSDRVWAGYYREVERQKEMESPRGTFSRGRNFWSLPMRFPVAKVLFWGNGDEAHPLIHGPYRPPPCNRTYTCRYSHIFQGCGPMEPMTKPMMGPRIGRHPRRVIPLNLYTIGGDAYIMYHGVMIEIPHTVPMQVRWPEGPPMPGWQEWDLDRKRVWLAGAHRPPSDGIQDYRPWLFPPGDPRLYDDRYLSGRPREAVGYGDVEGLGENQTPGMGGLPRDVIGMRLIESMGIYFQPPGVQARNNLLDFEAAARLQYDPYFRRGIATDPPRPVGLNRGTILTDRFIQRRGRVRVTRIASASEDDDEVVIVDAATGLTMEPPLDDHITRTQRNCLQVMLQVTGTLREEAGQPEDPLPYTRVELLPEQTQGLSRRTLRNIQIIMWVNQLPASELSEVYRSGLISFANSAGVSEVDAVAQVYFEGVGPDRDVLTPRS